MAAAIRLRVLGASSLSGLPERQAGQVLTRPKQLALLTYLALAEPGSFLRRDALCALLWPEVDTERARNSLRQSVHRLRRAIGAEAVVSRGDQDLCLAPDFLSCDAAEFREHASAGRHAEALALYSGELLPSFFAEDAAGFEEWLERERGRLRELAERSAWALAEQAEREGSAAAAARWGRRAVDLAPLDEVSVRRFMELLARLGDRAAAARVYDDYAQRLEREFAMAPSQPTRDLAAAIRRSLAAEPLPAAANLDPALPPAVPVPAAPPSAPPVRRKRWGRAAAFAAAGAFVLGGMGVAALSRARRAREPLDAALIVVAPFRTAGADSGLAFLREGMIDLLAATLGGGAGLRAADPHAVTSAYRALVRSDTTDLDVAGLLALARKLGAGSVLEGAVVGNRARLSLTAHVLDTRTGVSQLTTTVTGSLDQLPELVDRITARVLAARSREPEQRLAQLASASVPALAHYVAGRRDARRGDYNGAVRELQAATEADSTFAIAALELAVASDWVDQAVHAAASKRAWTLRSRLNERDRVYLTAYLGPSYPAASTTPERIAAWENAARVAPDRAAVLYGLGDVLFHDGTFGGVPDADTRAEAAFARALRLDSSYTAPLAHLLDLRIEAGDQPGIRALYRRYLGLDSTSEVAWYFRWRVPVAFGDSSAAAAVEARFGEVPLGALERIAQWSQIQGVRVEAARRAVDAYVRRAVTADEQIQAQRLGLALAEDEGRFSLRYAILSRVPGVTPTGVLGRTVADALSADGSPATARDALALLQDPRAFEPTWRLFEGTPEPGDSALIERVERSQRASLVQLRALWAARERAPNARALADSFASATLHARPDEERSLTINALARVYELDGEPRLALAALARRPREEWDGADGLAAALRMRGRLSALVGDTAAAIRAYHHYLALRADPDPGVRPFADTVRMALKNLEHR